MCDWMYDITSKAEINVFRYFFLYFAGPFGGQFKKYSKNVDFRAFEENSDTV